MPDQRKIVYWDACVFLSYINEHPDRIAVLRSLFISHLRSDEQITVYTSTLSHVEVAFAASEQQQQILDTDTERRINGLWHGKQSVRSADFHSTIAETSKSLIREGLSHGWSLKPADAIHLATAKWLAGVLNELVEFHTYDGRLFRYKDIVGFDIVRPYTARPTMF